MKNHLLTYIIPFFLVAAACGDSSSTTDSGTKPGDATVDKATTDTHTDGAAGAPADAPAEMPADAPAADAPAADTPADVAAAEAPADVAAADKAPTDGGVDARDAAVSELAGPDAMVQRLVKTVLVIDKIPGDGGTDASIPPMPTIDPNLVNSWGLAFNPTGPIWVANAGTGKATVYNAQGQIQPLVVTIPPPAGSTDPAEPTGQVFNPTIGFMGDKFIFSTEGGTIAGWQNGTAALTRAENATSMAIYKGLALGLRNNVPRLFATDFHNGRVDVYDQTYAKITVAGGFADPMIPNGYAPFGILAEGPVVFVTYAKQDAMAADDVKGSGNGYVATFDFDGVLTKRLVAKGALNAPWGLALAPANFGNLSHALLVGNFGDGRINAYDVTSGAFMSTAVDSLGAPIEIEGLWALVFGPGTPGAASNQLFFTAGPGDELHGVLGRLEFVP